MKLIRVVPSKVEGAGAVNDMPCFSFSNADYQPPTVRIFRSRLPLLRPRSGSLYIHVPSSSTYAVIVCFSSARFDDRLYHADEERRRKRRREFEGFPSTVLNALTSSLSTHRKNTSSARSQLFQFRIDISLTKFQSSWAVHRRRGRVIYVEL